MTEDERAARIQPTFAVESWDSGDYVVTMNGKPIGQSIVGFAQARYIALWLPTAWKELSLSSFPRTADQQESK